MQGLLKVNNLFNFPDQSFTEKQDSNFGGSDQTISESKFQNCRQPSEDDPQNTSNDSLQEITPQPLVMNDELSEDDEEYDLKRVPKKDLNDRCTQISLPELNF